MVYEVEFLCPFLIVYIIYQPTSGLHLAQLSCNAGYRLTKCCSIRPMTPTPDPRTLTRRRAVGVVGRCETPCAVAWGAGGLTGKVSGFRLCGGPVGTTEANLCLVASRLGQRSWREGSVEPGPQ